MAKYGSSLQQVVKTRQNSLSIRKEIVYAYVTDIAIGTNNPELEGAVKVVLPDTTSPSEWIFPINYHHRNVPTKGELVVVYPKDARGVRYYGPAINIHNYPSHNSVSAEVQETIDYVEPDYVNPYRLFAGDYLLEGRFGQSIRFSQTLKGKNNWSAGNQDGRSAIIISSGQQETADSSILLEENFDKDAAVLVLLEDGKLKYDGATDYEGHQALLISDRVHIKSRKENVDITSEESLNLQDSKWSSNLTEILDLIEILIQGGNIVPGSSVTGVNAEALQKLLSIKRRLANGN